jgi:hypothetical protein
MGGVIYLFQSWEPSREERKKKGKGFGAFIHAPLDTLLENTDHCDL